MTNTVEVSVRLNQRTGLLRCAMRVDDTLVSSGSQVTDIPDGQDTVLELFSSAAATDPRTRAVIKLESLEVRGADRVPTVPKPIDTANAHLLGGEYAAAAAAYADLGRDDLAAFARLEGGDAAAAEWFGSHPDHPLTQRLHRVRREVGQAMYDAEPDEYPHRIVRDLGSASRYVTSADVHALLLHPSLADIAITDASTCDVLRLRATAYAVDGRDGAALSTLARLVAGPANPDLERCQVDASLDAASILSRSGRVDEAKMRVQEAVARSATPDLVQSRAVLRPDLKSLFTP